MISAAVAGSTPSLVRVLVLHGPNLNMFGVREPNIYGSVRLSEINETMRKLGTTLDVEIRDDQSNHEGHLIDRLQAAGRGVEEGVVFNPGALAHYSYALHDAVKAIRIPVVEVHVSDISKREKWRKKSVIAPACIRQISGRGIDSYLEGLRHVVGRIRGER